MGKDFADLKFEEPHSEGVKYAKALKKCETYLIKIIGIINEKRIFLKYNCPNIYAYTFVPSGNNESLKKNAINTLFNATYPIWWKINAAFDGNVTFTDNVNNSTRGKEKTLILGLSLNRKVFKNLSMSTNYSFTKQTSKDKDNYSYEKHVLGVKGTMSY